MLTHVRFFLNFYLRAFLRRSLIVINKARKKMFVDLPHVRPSVSSLANFGVESPGAVTACEIVPGVV